MQQHQARFINFKRLIRHHPAHALRSLGVRKIAAAYHQLRGPKRAEPWLRVRTMSQPAADEPVLAHIEAARPAAENVLRHTQVIDFDFRVAAKLKPKSLCSCMVSMLRKFHSQG